MDVRAVTALPTLNPALFGDLPEIPEGSVLVLANTPWRKAEVEIMAAVIIQCCMTANRWQPVSEPALFKELGRHLSVRPVPHTYGFGMLILIDQGDIEAIELGGDKYVVPKPSLVSKALGSGGQIRYALLQSEQPTEPFDIVRPRRGLIATLRRTLGRFVGIERS